MMGCPENPHLSTCNPTLKCPTATSGQKPRPTTRSENAKGNNSRPSPPPAAAEPRAVCLVSSPSRDLNAFCSPVARISWQLTRRDKSLYLNTNHSFKLAINSWPRSRAQPDPEGAPLHHAHTLPPHPSMLPALHRAPQKPEL